MIHINEDESSKNLEALTAAAARRCWVQFGQMALLRWMVKLFNCLSAPKTEIKITSPEEKIEMIEY